MHNPAFEPSVLQKAASDFGYWRLPFWGVRDEIRYLLIFITAFLATWSPALAQQGRRSEPPPRWAVGRFGRIRFS